MNGKRARRERATRHRAYRAQGDSPPVLEFLWDNGRWVRLEDASARAGLVGPTTRQLLDYCLMRGYVRRADGPGEHDAFRRGDRYWAWTPGGTLLFGLGARPDTPVPEEWRGLSWDGLPNAS